MAEVKLFGVWASPFSKRVEVALQLKGVEYELIEEQLSNKSSLLLKYNPAYKRVPVLLHNGNPLAESLVILEYIDEAFPGIPILPKDPYQRAMTRFWAKFIDEKCLTAIWRAIFNKGEEQEKGKEEAIELLKILDNEVKNKKFFGGETIGFADITANFIAFWVGVWEEAMGVAELVTEEKLPNLYRWKEEFLNCDIIKENLPPKNELVAFIRARSPFFPKQWTF